MPSYRDFVKHRASISESFVTNLLKNSPVSTTRLLLIEDISASLINLVGAALNIDPLFFAEHIITNYGAIEKSTPPPSLAILPSSMLGRTHLHLHYQQVSNVPRNVRRLVPLSDNHLALVRGCISLLVKDFGSYKICICLVDRPAALLLDGPGRSRIICKASPLHNGFEQFSPPESFESFAGGQCGAGPDKKSVMDMLVHHYQKESARWLPDDPFSLLSLSVLPIRLVLAEWNTYSLLTTRYYQHYEYTFSGAIDRSYSDDIVDLQRWRRRSQQSQYKLATTSACIKYWMQRESETTAWAPILEDIATIRQRLETYSRSLEQTITVATSMVQLGNTQQTILEAIAVRRLTYCALVFIPLSWVAALFSMSDSYSPGGENFWVYFVTALPLLFIVLILSSTSFESLGTSIKQWFSDIGK
ncbi:Zinc transport [Paramyrothecium foliicola]|nr:Zinc transport [Paramyrothecium foliicola]